MAEKFFCTIGNSWVIPNIYNNNSKIQKDCRIAFGKKQSICDQCVMYINSPKTK